MFQEPLRIFVGSDRSQALAVKVLEYSIRRHTDAAIELTPMDALNLPEPADPRQGSRTGFSFTRFAIPRLAGYRGKALYLDADMQVFRDIRQLTSTPFGGASIIIQDDLPEAHQPKAGRLGAPKRRVKQSSVMLLDCDRLDWVPEDVIRALGVEYTYEELLFDLCIVPEADIHYDVPFHWNSLETYVPGETSLTHYTDMYTQPWVSAENPNGWVWLEEVRRMLEERQLSWSELEEEVALGYFRPSLIEELRADGAGPLSPSRAAQLTRQDQEAGFVKHREVYDRKRERKLAIARYERELGVMAASDS